MREIKLTMGMTAKVSDEWYEYLSQFKWYPLIDDTTGNYYAARNARKENGKHTTIRMHREIMATPTKLRCDHINHDTLDNRIENLRNVTTAQSSMNRGIHKRNKSGYKGVSRHYGRWMAYVDKGGKHVYKEGFNTPLEAALAYDREAKRHHGEFASLNFPEGVE